ncbi:MAG: type I secretion system permease/ATPase [Thauera sp.]|nr:type I secretion system permease/ATPase [Thauera sp.]
MTTKHIPLESSLLFLARHFELPVSESTLRASMVGVSAQMSVEQFTQAAERIGLACALGEQNLASITRSLLPLVLLHDDGSACVVVDVLADGRLSVFQPDFGRDPVALAREALAEGYSGVAIAVRARAGSGRLASAADPVGGGRARRHWFWGALAQNRWSYVQVALAAVLTNVLALTTSIFTMVVYDRILPSQAIDSLVALTIGVVIALAVDFIVKMLRSTFIDDAGHKADLQMGRRIFDHLLDMQLRSRKGSAGAFASLLREFETLRDFFTSASLATLIDLPFILLFLVVIYLICGPLAIVPALAVPAILLLGVLVQPLLARYAREAFEQGQSKQGVLVETISGLETVKTSGAAPLMRERWEACIRDQSGTGIRSRRISHLAVNAAAFAQQAVQIGIVVYGVFLVADGKATMGSLIAAVILAGRALAPLGQLAQIMTRINQARTSYQSLDRLMTETTEHVAGRYYVSRPHLSGKIEFRDVGFRYPDQQIDALQRVSFTIQPGEKVAILGRIGSGKSTVLRLLLGLYEQDQGLVLADDTDIRQIDPADLRANIGVVQQDVWLFSGTLRQNIAVGGHRPDDAAVLKAAQLAGVHEFVARHPLGYDMPLGEKGEGLSGGQRQAITIARAAVGDPAVLILDEPTSMMDSQTEQQVIQSLATFGKDKTVIVITHRTSLLAMVDRVIVLDGGRIVADGPKSLLTQPQSVKEVQRVA